MFNIIKRRYDSPDTEVVTIEPTVAPSLSFTEKMDEMAQQGRLWMFCSEKTNYQNTSVSFHLDIITPGLGKLELKSDTFPFDKNIPFDKAVDNLYSKYLAIKQLKF